MSRVAPQRLPKNGQPSWLKALAKGYFQSIFGECDIRGIERIPLEGPLIIASTHRSYLDPIILGAFIPRPIFQIAKSELFKNRIMGGLITAFGGFQSIEKRQVAQHFGWH